MKKHFRLSVISAVVTTATMLLASSAFAYGSYKGDYKGERMMPAPVCTPERCLHDGFYVGVGVSSDNYRARQSTTLEDPVFGSFITLNPTHGARGWDASIFGGYGQYWDGFYLAGEIFASASNAESSWGSGISIGGVPIAAHDTELKARTSYGIAVLPGFKINAATLVYARLGWIRTNFKGDIDGFTTFGGPFSFSESEWENGFQYGVGMESVLCENWSVRAEYTHTNYSSFHADQFINVDTKFSPTNNQFVAGLIYHFM